MRDADRMVRAGRHHLVDIGAEGQHLLPAIARPVELDGDERRVLDLDAAALGRRLQPEEPSASRFSTLANRQTSSFRAIGLPRYSQVPSRRIRKGRSPHSTGAR